MASGLVLGLTPGKTVGGTPGYLASGQGWGVGTQTAGGLASIHGGAVRALRGPRSSWLLLFSGTPFPFGSRAFGLFF